MLLFLTGPLAYMPNAVLAAVVFLIGLRLIDIKGMADIYRLRKGEFAVAAITAATVVIVGVEQGIILAMALSIIEHIYHSYRPYDTLVVDDAERASTPSPWRATAQLAPGLVVYRFGSGLYYANATRFTEEIMGLVDEADPPLRWLAPGRLRHGRRRLLGSGLAPAGPGGAGARRASPSSLPTSARAVRRSSDAYGLTAKIGTGNIYGSIRGGRRGLRIGGRRPSGPDAPATSADHDLSASAMAERPDARRAPSARRGGTHALPPADLGAWTPALDRPDPVALLEEQATTRIAELVPVRYGRMAVSPFTFYRGAALPMAADLAAGPGPSIVVQLCGDAHLANFGLFASPERDLLFDINDFDETIHGPFEFDLKRLAASLVVAGRTLRLQRARQPAHRPSRGPLLPRPDGRVRDDAGDRRLLRARRRSRHPGLRRQAGSRR